MNPLTHPFPSKLTAASQNIDAWSVEIPDVNLETRILAIGDPHFKTETVHSMVKYINQIVESLDGYDMIVVLGDLLHEHERLHTTALNAAQSFIARLSSHCPTYVLVGNHDYINNQQFCSTNHWMNAMKQWPNVTIVDSTQMVDSIVLVPYVPPGRFVEALDAVEWRSSSVIFAHQEIRGCKMGAFISVDGDGWDESWPLVVSGHVHDKQRPAPNVFYTGSSVQHAFGESGDKTISSIMVSAGILQVSNFRLNLPRKRTLYTTADTFQDLNVPDGEDAYRITLTASSLEFKNLRKQKKYKQLVERGVKICCKEPKSVENTHVDSGGAGTESRSFEDLLLELLEKKPILKQLCQSLLCQV